MLVVLIRLASPDAMGTCALGTAITFELLATACLLRRALRQRAAAA